MKLTSTRAVRIGTAVVALGGWEAVARSGLLPGTVLPPFSSVAAALYDLGSPQWFQAAIGGPELDGRRGPRAHRLDRPAAGLPP